MPLTLEHSRTIDLGSIRTRSRGGSLPFIEVRRGSGPPVPTIPNKGGRPSKFTPEVEKTILNKLGEGLPLKYAAHSAGISYDTLNRWINAGHSLNKAGEVSEPLALFCTAVRQAEASAVSKHVGNINKAADENWQASAWYLERRAPNEFGKKDKLTLGGRVDTGGVTIQVEQMREELPDGSLVKILQKVSAKLPLSALKQLSGGDGGGLVPALDIPNVETFEESGGE